MTDEILALLMSLAPGLVELAKKLGVDLGSVKREDLLLLILIDHHRQTLQILENQTKILNELHQTLQKVSEDTAVLLRRSEM
jgi:GTPase involved in cell partitioning and DNA repair